MNLQTNADVDLNRRHEITAAAAAPITASMRA